MKQGGYETPSYLSGVWSDPLKAGLENVFADAVWKAGERPGPGESVVEAV